MPCHSYLFFDSTPSLNGLSGSALKKAKKEFAAEVARGKNIRINPYATLGFKAGTRFMLHMNAERPEDIQDVLRELLHTTLGTHLNIPYALFGMTRASQYNPHKAPKESAPESPHRYLIVYPFTKTIEWHLLPFDERREVMKAHVDVGRKFTDKISQLLLYSYGVDDHEFIVSYQTDHLDEFQSLVMELRGTESRRHTKSDTPIFLCISKTISEALEMV